MNKILDMIFGAVGGPAVPIVEEAKGDKKDAGASLAGTVIAGTTAATIASLGTAAPAAGAVDAGVVGGEAAVDTGVGAGAASAAGAGVADAAATTSAASAAGSVAGAGASSGAADVGATLGAGAAETAGANVGSAGAAAAQTASTANAIKTAGNVVKNVDKAYQTAQKPAPAPGGVTAAPAPTAAPAVKMQAPTFAGPNASPLGAQYNAIFGAPPAPLGGAGMPGPLPSIAPPAIQPLTPAAPPAMSDRRVKADIRPATRSIQAFLSQLGGR